ncbi:MAG: hypothetical protein MUF18_10995 [Fimbriiglobus sp.]|jgi:hypothetical protein|nr:hypothetical protein [Fimbriiglobus sp.]
MPDSDPTDPPPARRAAPKTVLVRAADIQPEPNDDEPTGPPRVLFWFRLGCALVAVSALFTTAAAVLYNITEEWEVGGWIALLVVSPIVFAAYTLPLWWRRPKWWHWVYGLALMIPGVVPIPNPFTVAVLVFWFSGRTVRYFRRPPPSYAYTPPPAPIDPDAPPLPEPPGVLFALRWLCVIGCVACLLAMPITVLLHTYDPAGGVGVFWWLGGFAAGFVLFVVPLFARRPRPWVWWYGVGLLGVCSVSGYFTLLALPTLAFWLTRPPRAYFAGRGTIAAA